MRRALMLMMATTVWLCALSLYAHAQGGGWKIPPTAASEKSPLSVNDAVLAQGKKIFTGKCQRCHGATGIGDGPDAEAEHRADMDLTTKAGAAKNPDGVVFYKIWNGRTSPRMPAMAEDLTKDQVWALVAWVQTLRAK